MTVGRVSEATLCIPSAWVSSRHAELRMGPRGPVVHDLESTNGTHVNGQRVNTAELAEGDVLQFANAVYLVSRRQQRGNVATQETGVLPSVQALLHFDSLMNATGLLPHFQPIVEINGGAVIGYEMLARSVLDGLESPGGMFATATKLDQECALSELLRQEGTLVAATMKTPGKIFLNTHPNEISQTRLVNSLRDIRSRAPTLEIVIEIHEAAVTDCEGMRRLRDELTKLNMQLAYDDFGAGQARLDELAEVPPDYLKFDMKLIRNIDKAHAGRRNLVESLVKVVNDLGAASLAEGIETEGEAQTCRDLGFELAQGYLYGRPLPLTPVD